MELSLKKLPKKTRVKRQAERREKGRFTRRELRHRLGSRRTRRADVKSYGKERPRARLARLIREIGTEHLVH